MAMLIWACCTEGRRHIGWTGTVGGLAVRQASACFCGYVTHGLHALIDVEGQGYVPVSWIKKVDPAAPSERVERHDELMV